ncbi:MAG: pyridoxal-phosphate dependent enzyme [Bacteroidetes bacterium]|nr:pyridoxal-phosphate dependent enzyme [Bacteroidota bacterium]
MKGKQTDHIKRVYHSIEEMLSSEDNPTPIVQLNRVVPYKQTKLYAKLEWYNPFGSLKDRIGANLLTDAEEKGLMDKVNQLVEPTSGNTGFALAMLANAKGYSLKATLSSMIPIEKRTLLRFFGCDVLEIEDTLCPAPGAPEGAIALAIETAQKPDFHMLNQYSNQANPNAHYKTTGPEVWKQTEQKITHFVAALGTCGTLTGTGTFLKEKNSSIKLIGVHPEEGHDIPGVRSIIQLRQTKLFRPELYDQLIEVSNREAFDLCLRINREESIIAGPSSGLALAGAIKVIQDREDAVVVVIFPDNAFKYASSFQRHFPEMFENMVGSPTQSDIKNEKEELFDKMIELCRNDLNTIDLNEAYNIKSETNPIFIDVRSSDQYSATHIVDAINIPINNLLLGNYKLPKDKDYPIVTVCNVGNQSIEGLLILKSLGYSNVKSLNGGTTGWILKGFPIVKK